MEGDEHQRVRRLVSPAFTPRSADRLRPVMRRVIGGLVEPLLPTGRCELVARRVRAVPHPDHLRAARRPVGGLEALLGLGHRHLPHLQQRHRQRPRAHQGRDGRARRLRAGDDRRAPVTPGRRPPQRPDRRRGGRRPPLHRRARDDDRGRAHGRHRHHPQPARLLRRAARPAPRPVAAARRGSGPGQARRRGDDALPRRGRRHRPDRVRGHRVPRRPLPHRHARGHQPGDRQHRSRACGTTRTASTSSARPSAPRT